ncbi:MAG: XRE family transcriptional regulator [Clostridiales bacterium]|nr:MAG: XRE family transcriptional regulator [Clostridiales bacterium]
MEQICSRVVGEAIRKFRLEKRYSQEVLSGLAGIGRTHLCAIERGERKPTLETFFKIADALDVSATDIIAEIERIRTNENEMSRVR